MILWKLKLTIKIYVSTHIVRLARVANTLTKRTALFELRIFQRALLLHAKMNAAKFKTAKWQ